MDSCVKLSWADLILEWNELDIAASLLSVLFRWILFFRFIALKKHMDAYGCLRMEWMEISIVLLSSWTWISRQAGTEVFSKIIILLILPKNYYFNSSTQKISIFTLILHALTSPLFALSPLFPLPLPPTFLQLILDQRKAVNACFLVCFKNQFGASLSNKILTTRQIQNSEVLFLREKKT